MKRIADGDVVIQGTTVTCPMCGELLSLPVSFLGPGPDTGGRLAVEVDDGYLRQHLEAEHGG